VGVLSVTFDHEQRRVMGDRLAVLASGIEFDPNTQSSGVYVDPITETLMLKPRPVEAAWYTTSSGVYAKLSTSDFTWADSSKWETRTDQLWKGQWIATKSSASTGTGVTTTTYSKNRGFYIAYCIPGSQQTYLAFKAGWNNSASASSGVSIELYTDGTVLVLKDGAVVGSVKLTGAATKSGQASGSVLEMMLIPCRQRELLVIGGNGDGGSVVFEDIDDDDTDPTITGATKFWVEAVAGATQFQIAPLLFPSSGYASSVKMSFCEEVGSGETLENWTNPSWIGSAAYSINGHEAYVGTQTATAALKQWDGTTFTPDGTKKNCRVRVDMTTDNTGYSPFVYSVQLSYPPVVDVTDDSEEFDATAFLEECSLSVPEDPTNVGVDLVIVDPQTLEDDVALARNLTNRPVNVKIGTIQVLDGRTGSPEWEQMVNSEGERLRLAVDDHWKALENYVFSDRYLLDYLNFSEAIELLVKLSGIDAAKIGVSTTSLVLEPDASAKTSDHAFLIEAGDRASEWVKRLFDDLAADWWWGFKPGASGVEFFAYSPADLPSSSSLTLYPTIADAITGGVSSADAKYFVFRSFRQTVLEPEANSIRVTGWDPRTKRPFQVVKNDLASSDATTVPSSRPANWLGENRKYGLVDPSIRTQALANDACNYLYERLTPARQIAEIECEMLLTTGSDVPLWRGDVVTLSGKGLYRINSFGCDFEKDLTGFHWRKGTYTLEYIGPEEEE